MVSRWTTFKKYTTPLKNMTTEATIFIVDDNKIMHQVVERAIKKLNKKIVSYFSAHDFLNNVNPEAAGCLLLDFMMPLMNGAELYDQMRIRHFSMPVIMITAFGNVPLAVDEMKKGLFDFIEKPIEPQVLIDTVQRALDYDAQQREINLQQHELLARLKTLTPKEHEVMKKVVLGKLNKIIAYELGISMKTVEKHRAHVMEKMQAKSIAQLVHISERCDICT